MKTNILIIMLLLSSCAAQKQAKPCVQCPHYTKISPLFLDKVKLNPYPHEITYEKAN
jgi:hypothetical protein